jgi:hypothetical protein
MSLSSCARRLLANLWLMGALALTGCDTSADGDGPAGCNNSCVDDYDCPGALYCLDGACFSTECYSSNQCADEGSSCSVSGDCCMGNCNGGVCRSGCSSGADCVNSGQCCNSYSNGKRCGPC